VIDRKAFPVVDNIIRHIIHERHRHQRENFLNNKKGTHWNDIEKRRKYVNSQCTEKRERRMKTINKFIKLKNPLIEKLYNDELRPIWTDNKYHSLKVSETDDENPNKTRKRVYSNDKFTPDEEEAPVNAPSWTRNGYNGSLKSFAKRYISIHYSPSPFRNNNIREKD
ncbi:6543_t:CDS:2, partial [Funneliformis caledonium]